MTEWLLVSAIAVVLALPIAWRVVARRFDPFEPIVLFALAYGVMFVARPAAMLVDGQRVFWDLDVRPTLPRALVLALVGAVAFVVGYERRVGRSLAARVPAPRTFDSKVATVGALAVALLGLLALLVFLPLSDPSRSLTVLFRGRGDELGAILDETSTYLWYGSLLLVPAAFVLCAVALRERTLGSAVLAGLVLGLALVRVVPIGGRIALLPLLGGVFVLVYVMRDRRPRVPLLALLCVLALLGSYISLHVRDPNDRRTLATAVEDLRERPHAIFDPVLTGADAEMVLALSAALTVIPDELGYAKGEATVGNLAFRPIPRELWAGKPRPPGETVVATVWPHLYPGLDPAFSPLLVLYWDFGLAGVAVGMALFGVLAGLFFDWFRLHRRDLGAQLVFAMGIWFVVIGARNDPVDTVVLAAFLVGPMLLLLAACARFDRGHATRPEQASSPSVESPVGATWGAGRPSTGTDRDPRPLEQ